MTKKLDRLSNQVMFHIYQRDPVTRDFVFHSKRGGLVGAVEQALVLMENGQVLVKIVDGNNNVIHREVLKEV